MRSGRRLLPRVSGLLLVAGVLLGAAVPTPSSNASAPSGSSRESNASAPSGSSRESNASAPFGSERASGGWAVGPVGTAGLPPVGPAVSVVVPPWTAAALGLPSVAGTAAAAASDEAAPWVWPTGTRVIGRPWERPADDYSAGHRGIDVSAGLGTTAVAVDDGVVTFAGQVGGRPVLTIDHGDGLVSTLDSLLPTVAEGDSVGQGDAVGTVAVGHCPASDPCLHLGARVDGRYVDPTPYLPPAEWPVLLPESAWDE